MCMLNGTGTGCKHCAVPVQVVNIASGTGTGYKH